MGDSVSMLVWAGSSIAAVTGAVFALRKLWQLLCPIRIEPSVRLVFDGSGPDEIHAKILNRSRETQHVVRCIVRSTYPLTTILRRHLRNPLVSPRLYPNIWFNALTFDLLGTEPLKLEPFEEVELRHRLSDHPLSVFLTPMLQVEAQVSTQRVFRSRRLHVPGRWRFKGKGMNRKRDYQ